MKKLNKKNYTTPQLKQIGKIPTVTQHNHTGSRHDGGHGRTHKIPRVIPS